MISKQTINEVLERASLVELASETVRLKRQGSNYVGLCPFHAEKGASFNIRQDKFFHCFGCGASGNAIGFHMRTNGLSFPEAVEQLATRYGITIIKDSSSVRSNEDFAIKDKIFELNDLAQKYFQENLKTAPKPVIEYLRKRGLTQEAIKEFKIGFAPSHGLLSVMQKKGYKDDLLVKAGLARRSQNGSLYDYFRDRVIFPIAVDQRRIAGFGGRIIPELLDQNAKAVAPKYLNSLETPVYEKSKILYGLPQALSSLRGTKSIYVVEGYLDVVGLWMAGVKNAVATCGTAVTEQHIRRLKTVISRLDFLFDGDEAGRRGAGKTYPLFVNSGLEAACVFLPDGEDPDTFALANRDKTTKALEEMPKKDLFDCYLDQLAMQQGVHGVSDLGAAGKGKVAKIAAQVLANVTNPVEKSELQERLALLLKVDSASIAVLSAENKPALDIKVEQPATPAIRPIEALPAFDREILRCVMALKGSLSEGILSDQELCSVLQVESLSFLSELAEAQKRASLNKAEALRVLKMFGESWLRFWKDSDSTENVIELFDGLKQQAKRIRLDEQIDQMRIALKETNDPIEQMSIAQQKLDLERARDKYRLNQ